MNFAQAQIEGRLSLAQALLGIGDLCGAGTAIDEARRYSFRLNSPTSFALAGVIALRRSDFPGARNAFKPLSLKPMNCSTGPVPCGTLVREGPCSCGISVVRRCRSHRRGCRDLSASTCDQLQSGYRPARAPRTRCPARSRWGRSARGGVRHLWRLDDVGPPAAGRAASACRLRPRPRRPARCDRRLLPLADGRVRHCGHGPGRALRPARREPQAHERGRQIRGARCRARMREIVAAPDAASVFP